MGKARRVLWSLTVLLLGVVPAAASVVVTLPASKDNAIFQDLPNNSDGAGPEVYAGNNAAGNHRRGLMAFNTTSIPPGSTIVSVDLALTVTGIPGSPAPAAEAVELHRLLADWGEGSVIGGGGGGQGGPANVGDATWSDSFFTTTAWGVAGGTFAAGASAVQTIGGLGVYHWGSTAGMQSDVQAWVNNPSSNFGWLLHGDETINKTARAFASRTPDLPGDAPVLTVTYIVPGAVPVLSVPLLSTPALLGLMALLALGGLFRIARRSGLSGRAGNGPR
jgi:hypothetical protein